MRLIAFYLPQFHPIPENDRWWGKGFTEWRNVTRVAPLFEGQHQPQLPAELGFYDLRVAETREAQAELAREHGISGFCYYYYWFKGKKLLQRPLEEMLASGKPDFPFCVCWANENWTRRWDGGENEILAEQKYSESGDRDFLRALVPMFKDRRYIRIDGKPVLLIYRTELFPQPERSAQIWREEAAKAGLELYLVRGEGFSICKPESIGFDAAYEFPPNGLPLDLSFDASRVRIYQPREFSGHLHDYRKLAEFMTHRADADYTRFRGVMVAWDNTARRRNSADIFVNGDPIAYWEWLSQAIRKTSRMPDDKQFVFINAWNEWAEGCHLEPDQVHQRAYLEATLSALANRQPRFSTAPARQKGCPPAASENFEPHANWIASEVAPQLEARDRTIQFLVDQLERLRNGGAPIAVPNASILKQPSIATMDTIRGSLSSKLTAPVRWVGRLFRRDD